MTLDTRRAGILLHPSSLPSRFGIGDCGPETTNLFKWMNHAGLEHWQILPLGPTGFGDSPYQCFSAFAGNPLLISPEKLMEDGLVSGEDVQAAELGEGPVNYGEVFDRKMTLLQTAFHRFESSKDHPLHQQLLDWTRIPSVEYWLPDYALYKAIKDSRNGQPWFEWPEELRTRNVEALTSAMESMQEGVRFHTFIQFLFFHQWNQVRQQARDHGITIIGDAPIYVSADSADAWSFQPFFQMDDSGLPTAVAGVPPDYFSTTGQLWGNPLYDWGAMQKDGFKWWIERMRAIFETVDVVRLDHFRGFLGYYAVPAGSPTAEFGEWKKAPGEDFFAALEARMGSLPIIAENLGEITSDVEEARYRFGYPGMVILQFAWSTSSEDPLIIDPENMFAPHMHEVNSVVYSGTHDNDTSLGWWRHTSTPTERKTMQVYLATDGAQPNWDLIRCGMASVANTFIAPAQDLLDKDTDARMNMPGRGDGNWSWRLYPGELSGELADRIRCLTLLYGRCSNPPPEAVVSRDKLPPY